MTEYTSTDMVKPLETEERTTTAPQTNDEWGAAWDRFLQSRSDSGFMQSYHYARVLRKHGWGYFDAFLLKENAEIEGGGRVFIGHIKPGEVYFYMPDGPLLSEDAAIASEQFSGMLAYIEDMRREQTEKVTHLRLEPRLHNRPDFIDEGHQVDGYTEPRHTLYIDIDKSKEDLLSHMKYYGRYRVKKAIKLGVTVVQDNSADGFNEFLTLYKETTIRQGISAVNFDYLRSLVEILGADKKSALFFAEYNGIRLATALVIYFGDRATYFFAASNKKHPEVMAPYLLNFEIMVQSRAMGCRWYDFYGISPEQDKDHPLTNISQFKRKFGGEDRVFIPTLDFIFDEASYRAYRRSVLEP